VLVGKRSRTGNRTRWYVRREERGDDTIVRSAFVCKEEEPVLVQDSC
jgi:hypothetical protein